MNSRLEQAFNLLLPTEQAKIAASQAPLINDKSDDHNDLLDLMRPMDQREKNRMLYEEV